MADLASTRVFGKLTVMHDAIVKANVEIVGNVTAAKFIGDGSRLTSVPWASLAGVPATATRWPAWGELTGKPSAFTPSPHGHGVADIKGLSDAATTTISKIRSGTTKGDVGLSNVRNVDAYAKVEFDSEATANSPMVRNNLGDVWCRLFRSSYSTTNPDIGGIYTTKAIGGDYIRPSTPDQVKAAMKITSQDVGAVPEDGTMTRYDLAVISTTGAMDLSKGCVFEMNASTSRTVSFTNKPPAGRAQPVVLDITGSAGAITWPVGIDWDGGDPPDLKEAWTQVSFRFGNSVIRGFVTGGSD